MLFAVSYTNPNQGFDREELARIAVADQMRRIHHSMLGQSQDVAEFESLADRLAGEAEWLETGTTRVRDETRWVRPESIAQPGEGEEFPNSIDRPVSGRGNPWSVPLRVMREGDKAVATVNLGKGFEGGPGRAHGGVVAAIYDDLCGFQLILEEAAAFTAFIKVDYQAATPLSQDITYSAWVTKRDGRKIFMAGECVSNGEVITTCEGLFIEAAMAGEC